LFDALGQKVAQRFTCIRDCLRFVDSNKNGYIDRGEIRRLFAAFNMAQDQADLLFDALDPHRAGELTYEVFQAVVGQHIQPGHIEDRAASPRPLSRSMEVRQQEAELREVAEVVGAKAQQRFRNAREVFRFLDVNKDGRITREGCRRFAEYFGLSSDLGDMMFDMTCPPEASFIDYTSFIARLGPYILPGHDPHAEVLPGDRGDRAKRRPSSARAAVGRDRPGSGGADDAQAPAGARPLSSRPSSARSRPMSAGVSRMRTYDSTSIRKRMSPDTEPEFTTTTRDMHEDGMKDASMMRPMPVDRSPGTLPLSDVSATSAPASSVCAASVSSVSSAWPPPRPRPRSARPQSARAPTPPLPKEAYAPSEASTAASAASASSGSSGRGDAHCGQVHAAEMMQPPIPVMETSPNGAVVIRRRGSYCLASKFPLSARFRPMPGGGGGGPRRGLFSEVTHAPLTRELMNTLGKTWSIL